MREHHIDVLGPLPGASASVKSPGWTDTDLEDAHLLAVVAAKRGHANGLAGEFIDLTGHISDGKLYWDVPQGFWRIFFVVEAGSGPDVPLSSYINVLDENSVKVLLDAVYEPFYARYGEGFGETFAGFSPMNQDFIIHADSISCWGRMYPCHGAADWKLI